MKEKSGLERALADSKFTSESRILIDARGSIQRSNLRDWDATGTFRVENFFYNEVPIVLAAADFYMSPLDYIFDNVEAVFDYRAHERRKEFDGPASGTVRVRQIHFDTETDLTSLITLKGKAWPAPLLQLFIPDTAQHIAETYRFRNPPYLVANGLIDHRNPDTRTDMLTEVTADGLTDCNFLGQSVEVSGLSLMSKPSSESESSITRVSILLSTPLRRVSPRASAASTRARLVRLLEPGGRMEPTRGSVTGTM